MTVVAMDRRVIPFYPRLAAGSRIVAAYRHVVNLVTEAQTECPVALVDECVPRAPRQLRMRGALPALADIPAVLAASRPTPFDCTLRLPQAKLDADTLEMAWRWLLDHAASPPDTFSRAMHRRLTQGITALLSALDGRLTLGESVAQLIGLGAGLTPSGDDFLCGLLLALHLPASPYREQRMGLRAAVLCGLQETHLLSAAFLRDAASTWQKLVDALHQPCASRSHALLADATAFGHRSGFDLLSGLLSGLPHSIDRRVLLCPYIPT